MAITETHGKTATSSNSAGKALATRQTLFFEGDPRTAIYRVEQGCLKLYRTLIDGQRQVVGFARAGDLLGLESTGEYLNTAEAVTPVRVTAIPVAQVAALCRRDGDFAEDLLEQVGRQLAAAQSQIATIGAQSADQRVANFLLSMSDHDENGEIDLPMRRGDIAEFLGLRIETVSRKFSEFQRRGWIKLTSLYHCVLKRPDILEHLAAGGEGPLAHAA